jgi:hypothetical protein
VDVENVFKNVFCVQDDYVVGKTLLEIAKFICDTILRKSNKLNNPFTEEDERYEDAEDEINDVKKYQEETVIGILSSYTSERYTSDIIKEVAYKISGNIHEINSKNCIVWDRKTNLWAPLYVKECLRLPVEGRKHLLSLLSLAGPSAGMVFTMVRSGAYIQHILRDIGIPRYEEYEDEDLGGMCFTAILQPSFNGINMEDIHTSNSQKERNKTVNKERLKGCSGIYPPFKNKKCTACPIGRDYCALSRIDKTFNLTENCVHGHTGLFREDNKKVCFFCMKAGRYKDTYEKRNNRDARPSQDESF